MSSIDNRVVQMTFDNAAFEKKLDQTIKSLESLRTSIEKTGKSNGLQDLNTQVKKFDMSKMSLDVSGTSKKFLALSTVALTALSQITKSVISTGTQMVKSLSFDLIKGGFEEYETNMKSIQTILANTAADNTNLTMVNAALDELNSYADLTIYNFAEMARNIGTFTAAGVDLETSTASIKGIANLAAISGSNSQQASTAMYQLSQAIASGTVKLMDWNSVVNAGMGGEVFQRALFETGKTLGTITDVPIEDTFDDWTAAGNTFRGSLQDGWITSEVLTTTLRGFTGEMKDAELAAMGFTEAQIVNIQKMGVLGIEAATKVRTLTQLFDTAKEAVGSGWSLTFRTVIGDFEQATELFTSISDVFTKVIDNSSAKRNDMLTDWEQWGGRTFLIESLGKVFTNVGRIIRTVSSAFRDVFPAKTAQDIYLLTLDLKRFADDIGPAVSKNLGNIKRITTGVANGFKIFSTVVKEAAKFALDFFGAFTSGDGKSALDRTSEFAEKITELKETLVDEGGIANFFDKLREGIDPLKKKVDELKVKFDEVRDVASEMFEKFKALSEKVLEFFGLGTAAAGAMGSALNRRFSFLSDLLPEFNLSSLLSTGSAIVKQIAGFVGGIFEALTESFSNADYDSAFDVLNTGIFAAIGVAIGKLATGESIFGGITDTLDELTGVLSAMQADLKANVILKIAAAVGILAVSMLILSTIDSASLSKALVAMAYGFGQLVAAMVVMTKINFGAGAIKLAAMAGTLVILAGAILVLAVAIKIMSTMSLQEAAIGLGAVAVALGVMVGALYLMPDDAKILKSAVSIGILAGAMFILATAMKILGTMSFEEIAKGLAAVIIALTAFVLALDAMPNDVKTIKAAVSIGILAGSLLILSTAMKLLGTMSWEEMAKGLGGVIVLLGALVVTLNLLPKNMALQAAGLLALSLAIGTMAAAVKLLSGLSIGELLTGLAGLAGLLFILAAGMFLMQGSIGGSVALGIAAVGIKLLASALKTMAGIGLFDMVKALAGLAIGITLLAIAANMLYPALPAMLLLGAAMLAIGIGVAGIGIGIKALASGLTTLVRLFGTTGEQLGLIIQVIFGLFDDFVAAMVDSFRVLLSKGGELLPEFFEFMNDFFTGLAELVIEQIPNIVSMFVTFITELVAAVVELAPLLYKAGLTMIQDFLQVIADNIPGIVSKGAEIITSLITGLTEQIPDFVAAVKDLIVEFIKSISDSLDDIVTAGADLIISFLQGIAENALKVVDAGFNTLISFLEGLADSIRENRPQLVDAGLDVLAAIFEGITEGVKPVTEFFKNLIPTVVGWIGDALGSLYGKGMDFLKGLMNGVIFAAKEVNVYFRGFPAMILAAIGQTATTLFNTGKNFIIGLFNGAISFVNEKLMPWFFNLPGKILGWVGTGYTTLRSTGINLIKGLWNGMLSMGTWLADKVKGFAKSFITNPINAFLQVLSPSRKMMETGVYVGQGLAIGIDNSGSTVAKSSEGLAGTLVDSFKPDMGALKTTMGKVHEVLALEADNLTFAPTITPVLDMDAFRKDASGLNGLLSDQRDLAKGIALNQNSAADSGTDPATAGGGDVTFEQNIYAPQELSASEIYRQTRNQITIAKEELAVR